MDNRQQQGIPPQVYYNDKPVTVYDPISDTFVDQNSERGRLIKRYNDLCEKCGVSEVFVTAENKCKSIKNKSVLKKYEDEINYCKKYNKKIRKLVKTESKILENILNIKLPGGKGILKDYVPEISNDNPGIKKISRNTGVKDTLLSKIINFSPVVVFTIYKLAAENPELAKYAAKKAIEIISDSKGAIGSFFTKTVLKNINFGSMKAIVSGLSFSKFLQFFTGLAVVISNFSFEKNKKTSDNIQKTQVFDEFTDNYSSSIFDGDIVKINKETIDPVSLYDLEKTGLLTGKNRDSVSLRTLGIKSQDIVKTTKQSRNPAIIITKAGVNNETGIPYVIVKSDARDRVIDILPENTRKAELKNIKEEISRLSKITDENLSETEKMLQAITLVNQLNNKKSQLSLQEQNRTNPLRRTRKEMETEKKLSQEIKGLEDKISNFYGKKGTKNWVLEQQSKQIEDIEFSKRSSIINKKNIERLRNELEDVNYENYNYYRENISKNLQTLILNSGIAKKQSGISHVAPISGNFNTQKGKQKIEKLSPKRKSPEIALLQSSSSVKISPKTNNPVFIQEISETDEPDSSKISDLLSKIIINKKN